MTKSKTTEYIFKITATEYRHRKISKLMRQIENSLISNYKFLDIEYYKKHLAGKSNALYGLNFNKQIKSYDEDDGEY